jgi:hypothetical protein
LCLTVAWVFVPPRTCIGGRRVISSNGGHYKQLTLVNKVPDTLTFINLLLAAVQLSVGARFEFVILCLQSLARHEHRVKGSGVSPSHLPTLLVNRFGLSTFVLLSTTTLSISSPQEANNVCSLPRSTWLLVEVFFDAQLVCQFLTQLAGGRPSLGSRCVRRPSTVACHARKKDNGVVDLEIRRELLDFWASNKCDGPWNKSRTMIAVLGIDLFARERASKSSLEIGLRVESRPTLPSRIVH